MGFIETVPEEHASGAVAEIYAEDRSASGTVPNYTRAFSLRPEVYTAWKALADAVRDGMERRRYELATVAAARRPRSSYCMLADGSVLVERFLEPDELRAVVTDHRAAGLDAVDVAVMDLAEKLAEDATRVTQADVDGLRALGLSDTEITDVVLAAALRCFFTKVLDGLGTQPDPDYTDTVGPALRELLTVGRPIAERS